jgi:MFS family permease
MNGNSPTMDRGYGWVMVALGALMTCVAVGAMFSLAVFLEPMTRDTGWSRAGISSAMSLNFIAMGVAGFGWGALSDRIGTRKVVLAGSVLLGLGLAVASRATSQTAFLLSYGIIVGVAAGSFFAPMISAVMSWFERRRSLAVALVSVGVGVAPLTLSPFAAWLVARTDWRTAQLAIAVLAWALLIPAAFLVRQSPSSDAPGLAIQALAAGTFVFAARLDQFYAIAAVFGFAYGGVMPLYAVLAREYFGQRILGTVLGAATMVSSVGMALGPLGGGWIFDTFGRYTWLYVGSFALGVGAVAIALFFPPLRRAAVPQPA